MGFKIVKIYNINIYGHRKEIIFKNVHILILKIFYLRSHSATMLGYRGRL